jgi:hypothetical protein
MDEQQQAEEQGSAAREIRMEEMTGALYGGAKAGVGQVAAGIGGLFSYSWKGFQYAAGDLKWLASRAIDKVQQRTAQKSPEAAA